jgi:Arc/MetJ-type ribon-helix-helix transcriptional regulator
MPYPFPQDLQELVGARLATGNYQSEDDVLRDALRALADEDDDLGAVNEALAQWQAGDPGVSLEEAFAAVRSGKVRPTDGQ